MANRLQPRDPIRAYQRKARASRRAGAKAKCSVCGESRPEALIAGSNPTICTECRRKADGENPLDNHHPAGRANNPAKISAPSNDHRAELTPAQQDWPKKTLGNPGRSPLLAAAACERGFIDTNSYLIERLLYQNPEMLETLDAFLEERLGARWWEGTPLEKYAPKP